MPVPSQFVSVAPSVAAFMGGYVETAMELSFNDDQKTREKAMRASLDETTIVSLMADCSAFISNNIDDLRGAVARGHDWEKLGCDFWLTRNGHGAGFWDRGLEELGDRLTAAAEEFGNAILYLGDDGKIYHCRG